MWQYIVIPLVAAAVAQLVKIVLGVIRGNADGWRQVWSYGGMPSIHAAFTVSLCTVLLLGQGIGPALAVAVVFTLLMLNDALMLRRQVGDHARVIDQLVEQLPDNTEYKYPILTVRIGHTFPEIIIGAVLGAVLALLLWAA